MLSWPNIAENVEICVRIVATFVLIQETSDRIDVTCAQMLVSVDEMLLISDKTDAKARHEQNCAAIAETSGATHVTSGKTVAI